MENVINNRISELRKLMKREKLSAFIFPSTDPHNGEYVPEHWKGREWISGFDGSAGIAVVTMDKAALWTDSRYFIAAAEQLKDTEYILMKDGMPDTPTVYHWLGLELSHTERAEVGMDGRVNSEYIVKNMELALRSEGGITLRSNFDPLDKIWTDRPGLPEGKIVMQPLAYAGESCCEKICRICKILGEMHVAGMLVSTLDDIAWTLNLRGDDVECNPVFLSYLLITRRKVVLFVDRQKMTDEVGAYLKDAHVEVKAYADIESELSRYDEYSILLDTKQISHYLYNKVRVKAKLDCTSPIPMLKSVKNATEVQGYHHAMLKDGIAMVKFLKWLMPAVQAGGQSEMSVSEKLASLRAEQPLYMGLSFPTIAAYQEHGAIVHYEANEDTNIKLKPEGLLLLDSGAQYLDGTTDITRTIALGPVSAEQKHIYTLVLKGHIQLELCKFPDGVSGTQLDIMARKDMWREGLNFLHGTGHGVGSYLNVHEGPHQIRMNYVPARLHPYMTVTDEPGIYLEGKFGVRIENVLMTIPYMQSDNGEFLQFESLTLCPIDKTPIEMDLMTDEEIQWLNAYHKTVYDRLSPYLNDEEKEWLRSATDKICK
jgi:Xaa-Pro aminopeptidase